MTAPGGIDYDSLNPEDFEGHLEELFARTEGKVSEDPRLQKFFAKYPDCLKLARDLETIADAARSLLEPVEDPAEHVWTKIQNKLREETGALEFEEGEDEGLLPNGGAVS